MAGINLIINGFRKGDIIDRVVATKSNHNHCISIPFQLHNYSHLIDLCNEAIPIDWNNYVQSINEQIRNLVVTRQQFMIQCKAQFPELVQPILDQYPSTYPEEFI